MGNLKRKIIEINKNLCNGCGNCIPNCPEGAIQVIDGKARLVSDRFCDGLGACLGECPQKAITTIEREAEPYNEAIVMENIVKQGENTIRAHLDHLKNHNEQNLLEQAMEFLKTRDLQIPENFQNLSFAHSNLTLVSDSESPIGFKGCPGALSKLFLPNEGEDSKIVSTSSNSKLANWPIQLSLAPIQARYYQEAVLLIAADCTVAVTPDFHQTFLNGRTLLMGCPKFDDKSAYLEKLSSIFELNSIRQIHILMMEVPCCSGLEQLVKNALIQAKKINSIPITLNILNSQGNIIQ